ncbi:dna mismatch repair c-terminal domain-containing protein, partial [Cystoisospora suis]
MSMIPTTTSTTSTIPATSSTSGGSSTVTLLNTRGTASKLIDAACSVYGARLIQQCTQISLAGHQPNREWKLEALLSRPPFGVRTAAHQQFFVNRRVVDFPPLLQKLINKRRHAGDLQKKQTPVYLHLTS